MEFVLCDKCWIFAICIEVDSPLGNYLNLRALLHLIPTPTEGEGFGRRICIKCITELKLQLFIGQLRLELDLIREMQNIRMVESGIVNALHFLLQIENATARQAQGNAPLNPVPPARAQNRPNVVRQIAEIIRLGNLDPQVVEYALNNTIPQRVDPAAAGRVRSNVTPPVAGRFRPNAGRQAPGWARSATRLIRSDVASAADGTRPTRVPPVHKMTRQNNAEQVRPNADPQAADQARPDVAQAEKVAPGPSDERGEKGEELEDEPEDMKDQPNN